MLIELDFGENREQLMSGFCLRYIDEDVLRKDLSWLQKKMYFKSEQIEWIECERSATDRMRKEKRTTRFIMPTLRALSGYSIYPQQIFPSRSCNRSQIPTLTIQSKEKAGQ